MDRLERNKALVRQAFEEIINGHDPDMIRKYTADNPIEHSIFGGARSIDQLISNSKELNRAFPYSHLEIIGMIAEGDKVVTRGIFSGTHKGDFAGIPATGKKFSIVEIDIVRIERDKMVEHWDAADTASMYQQLGITSSSVPQA